MRLALNCPNCRHPLTSMDARGLDYFCEACFLSLAVVEPDVCYYQLGGGTGRIYRCPVSSLAPSA